ncbi:MAG: hypothetical protein M0Q53_16255 [Prolixibacteraceae bacterium]|nr:hypothetical protein [Prolixibacteraceae bacterium]
MRQLWGFIPEGLNVNSPGLSDEGAIPRVIGQQKTSVRDGIWGNVFRIVSDGRMRIISEVKG